MASLDRILEKKIIQGGMGVGVSGYRLAREVSSRGQLGIVSVTGANIVLARRLQQGDPGGELRDALSHFPNQDISEQVFERFFIEGGKAPEIRYSHEQFPSFEKTGDAGIRLRHQSLEDALVVGAFVEVYLAKNGHQNPVGANFLNKIEWAQLPTLYGAMLAGADVVAIGAGFPREIPAILSDFMAGDESRMSVTVSGKPYQMVFNPARFNAAGVERPAFLGVVGNHLGVKGLPQADGYVFEGPDAGGHNPPPRSKELTASGEPMYGQKDEMNFDLLASLLKRNGGNQPFWMAGGYATRLPEALLLGASGVQVGTPFAFSQESGLTPQLRRAALSQILTGAEVYTNPRASPTGFPFKELLLPGTLAIQEVYEARERRCDIGFLSEIFKSATDSIDTRCPGEPLSAYLRKGGDLEDTTGIKCLCNGLAATAGLGMPGEKPIVTSGVNLMPVRDLVERHGMEYSARDVIAYILER